MQTPADVINVGTDTSGRSIWMTRYMADWWARVVETLDFRPTIVQGAFMVRDGGGASESAGFHDGGGCLDLRTWDLTADQLEATVRTLRVFGAGAWRRDNEHGGFDPHLHFVLGTDYALALGARNQWAAYLAGHDGLSSNGPDYEWRPSPLVTTPPPEDDMANYAEQLDTIQADVKALTATVTDLAARFEQVRKNTLGRDQKMTQKLRQLGLKDDQILAVLEDQP